VQERQSEYWTSRQIEDRLLDAGYDVDVWPVPQRLEKQLPADFLFSDPRLKLFGLQYKALYDGQPDYWPLSTSQHRAMSSFPWIYYCLSDLTERRHRRRALDLARFVKYGDVSLPRVYSGHFKYARWGMFLSWLEDCSRGTRADELDDATGNLLTAAAELAEMGAYVDLFMLGLDSGRAIKLTTAFTDQLWIGEEDPE
jgi:hypothetical protein